MFTGSALHPFRSVKKSTPRWRVAMRNPKHQVIDRWFQHPTTFWAFNIFQPSFRWCRISSTIHSIWRFPEMGGVPRVIILILVGLSLLNLPFWSEIPAFSLVKRGSSRPSSGALGLRGPPLWPHWPAAPGMVEMFDRHGGFTNGGGLISWKNPSKWGCPKWMVS